ncbi:hypothetical protein EZS27_029263 [termite gut metagenome]|uniref:Uncharacterized protein n=1 Tax=termite gut metagenome TaxID=433724 RepID=A0A5J4QJ58_9ZZZZ
MYNEEQLIKAIEQSFKMYKLYGARSTAKLKPIHKFVADTLTEIYGKSFEVHFMGDETKEMTVDGKYYPKNIDITVTKNGEVVFCLGIKFVTSNYKQNANNYFENMMGETANIQALGNLSYAQLIILRHETPYYKKNETETPSKIEIVNDKDIQKYLNLVFDYPQAHRPNYIGIQVINVNEVANKVALTNLDNSFSAETSKLLNGKLSLTNFFKEISEYKDFLITKE